jgi:hypothetical protein
MKNTSKQRFGTINGRFEHGLSKHSLHRVWRKIIDRCYNEKNKNYNRYGGRGILIYNDWIINFKSFYDWCMANGYKEGLTIDRENNNGNYEPSNCRWVTMKVNARNKENTILITFKTQTKPIGEWCELLNFEYGTIYQRIFKLNQTPEIAFSKPSQRNQLVKL